MVAAIRVHKVGGPEVLTYEDIEVGAPGPGQIRVKQRACGVNFIDTYYPQRALSRAAVPFIPGNEAAGEVVAVGEGVKDFKVGDRVTYKITLRRLCRRTRDAGGARDQTAGRNFLRAGGGHDAERHDRALLAAADVYKVEKGSDAADACGGGRRRPHHLPMGKLAWRHRDRHRRLEGKGRARQGQWLPACHPLPRGGFRRAGEGDHRRQAVRRGL